MSLRKLALIIAASSAVLAPFAATAEAADGNGVGDVVLRIYSGNTISNRTRAEVTAEMMAARRDGALLSQRGDVVILVAETASGPSRPREDVRKEAIAASRAGALSRGDVVLY